MALRSHGIVVAATTYNDGGAAIAVTGGYDTFRRKDEHIAATLHPTVDVLYAVHEVLALRDEQGHKLGGVGLAAREVGELLVAREAVLLELVDVVDLADRADGKAAKVRVDHDGLGLGVADHSDADIAGHLDEVF